MDTLWNIEKRNDTYISIENELLKKHPRIWVEGECGTGKTYWIKYVLKKMGYDMLYYSSLNVRNKHVLEELTSNITTNRSVISFFNKKIQKIVLVIDHMETLQQMDKTGIVTINQWLKNKNNFPLICITSDLKDKRLNELKKHFNTCIHLDYPTLDDIKSINTRLDQVENLHHINKKINFINSYQDEQDYKEFTTNREKSQYIKKICSDLFVNKYKFHNHNNILQDTDRTIVSLLYHENIPYTLKFPEHERLYYKILSNYSFSDYHDRITFQKQIWLFNELSPQIKIMYNHYLWWNEVKEKKYIESDFTKILTKYSSEYGNYVYLKSLSEKLHMDEYDIYAFALQYFSLIQDCYLEPSSVKRKNNLKLYDIDKFQEKIQYYQISVKDMVRLIKFMSFKFRTNSSL